MKRRDIDPQMAARLYDSGCSWTDVGRILAIMIGRSMPFQATSVQRAVRAWDRRPSNETGELLEWQVKKL